MAHQIAFCMMLGGLVGATGAHLWTAVCAARDEGLGALLLCLLVPGYVVFYAHRYERAAMWAWLGSLAVCALGTALT